MFDLWYPTNLRMWVLCVVDRRTVDANAGPVTGQHVGKVPFFLYRYFINLFLFASHEARLDSLAPLGLVRWSMAIHLGNRANLPGLTI